MVDKPPLRLFSSCRAAAEMDRSLYCGGDIFFWPTEKIIEPRPLADFVNPRVPLGLFFGPGGKSSG